MKDFWILTLVLLIIAACVPFGTPIQMIDCTKPLPLKGGIDHKPVTDELVELKKDLSAAREEIHRLRWEADLYREQRDEAYKTVNIIPCDYD